MSVSLVAAMAVVASSCSGSSRHPGDATPPQGDGGLTDAASIESGLDAGGPRDGGPPPANASCGSATPVTDGTHLLGEQAGSGTDTLASVCLPSVLGKVLYYSTTVPAGERLVVATSPSIGTAFEDPVIRLLSGCGAGACLTSSPYGSSGESKVTYDNPTGSDLPLIIAVGAIATETISYDLSVRLVRSPYAMSPIPVACDDMSSAMTVNAVSTDDSYSAAAPLPFSIDFFGDTMSDYWISSNGLLGLEATPVDPSDSYSTPYALPHGNPTGVVAPFWDDLTPVLCGPTSVSVQTFGTSPNRHFTVAWSDWELIGHDMTSLTFQVQLYEGTNVIELHYCSLSGSASQGTDGRWASIGLENAAGTDAVQYAYDTQGALSSGTAIRFTP